MVLVHDVIAGTKVGERAQRAAAGGLRTGRLATALVEAVVGDHREAQRRCDEPFVQCRLGKRQLVARWALLDPAGLEASEVEGRALAIATPRPGDHGPVTGAQLTLERRLRLCERARDRQASLRMQLDRRAARKRREPNEGPPGEDTLEFLRRHVELVRVVIVEGCTDVGPVVAKRRRDLLARTDDQRGLGTGKLEQRLEAVEGKQLGDIGALAVARLGRQERPVLERELSRGCDLDAVDALEGSLRERREAA